MSKFWFVFKFIGCLVLLGFLVLGGAAIFNAGWSQGLVSASAPAAATGVVPNAAAIPYGPYGMGMHSYGMHHGFLGFGFGLIPFLLFLFFIGLAVRFFFCRPMMGHGFHGHGLGHCSPFGHHRHMGPPSPEEYNKWYQEWEKGDPSQTHGDNPDESNKKNS